MATFTERPSYGQSSTGGGRGNPHIFAVNGSPSGLCLLDSAGTEYVVWVTTGGVLKIGTRAQFDAQTGASSVGAQT